MEDERRLFYVAVTQATSNLIVSYVRHAVRSRVEPGQFLAGMGLADAEEKRARPHLRSRTRMRPLAGRRSPTSARSTMMAHWCVNFDAELTTLQHGLGERLWLMQYQYSHGGLAYQGHPDQIASTTNNWRQVLSQIRPGDWLVAYLARPARFFAVGRVIEPRERGRYRGRPRFEDTVERTTAEHRHLHLGGVVRYTDTPAAYEDFTDPWHHRGVNPRSEEEEVWRYPQRIDVRQWLHHVPGGVTVPGLNDVVGVGGGMTRAAFVIPDDFYAKILGALRAAAPVSEEEDGYDPEEEGDYELTDEDTRERVLATIKARRGQDGFRNSLRGRYGDACMVTGCPLLALLEAAHLRPYRGEKDN
ncbi:MAG TPA: hypothetical protein VKE74_16910, partial [Gemmataceae bacterium]|nr:hypothetical protein [Gemmataceae bacterium]